MITFLTIIYHSVGIFAVTWSLKGWIGMSTTRLTKFPLVGDLHFSEIIFISIPVLCVSAFIELMIVRRFRKATRGKTRFSGFPATPESKLRIPSEFAWIKMLLFVAYIFFPMATTVKLAERVPGNTFIYDYGKRGREDQVELRGLEIFSFPSNPHFMDGKRWRWYEPFLSAKGKERGVRVSAYPGIQPILSVVMILGLIVWSLISCRASLRHPSKRAPK